MRLAMRKRLGRAGPTPAIDPAGACKVDASRNFLGREWIAGVSFCRFGRKTFLIRVVRADTPSGTATGPTQRRDELGAANSRRVREHATAPFGRHDRAGGSESPGMSVNIKILVQFSVSNTALEDAMAEYDELTVEGLVREILDKAIACDEITAKLQDGPKTLEEYDQLNQ